MIRETHVILSGDMGQAPTIPDLETAIRCAETLAAKAPGQDIVVARIMSISRDQGGKIGTDKGLVTGRVGRSYTLHQDAPGLPGTSGMPVELVGFPNDPRFVTIRFGVPVALDGRPITEAKHEWCLPAAVLDLMQIDMPERKA